jgi:S1-C subfamily serine protease
MDPRVISASTRVFDALLPAGDELAGQGREPRTKDVDARAISAFTRVFRRAMRGHDARALCAVLTRAVMSSTTSAVDSSALTKPAFDPSAAAPLPPSKLAIASELSVCARGSRRTGGEAAELPVQSDLAEAGGSSSPKSARTVDLSGTAFVISTNGHVVTNNHVVGSCVGDIHGNLTGESAVTLRIVSKDDQ